MAIRTQLQRAFFSTPGTKATGKAPDGSVLPGFGGLTIREVWKPFLTQLRKTSLSERASGISFNIVMAIPPTLIFVFTLIPYLPISKQFIHQIFVLIRDIVPGEKNNS
ncbi:MAG TPA: YihY/virulence factor BrkB family protein, partial [Flavisolibacter sp.]|nr:YihY/virulence factor BrkB family protein [Flavisolibacter sp.]